MSQRSPFLSGLSAFQLAAGALAAMTSAWIASALGVAGTIIGAAVGSLVVSVTSAFYANTLHKGRTLVVQAPDGSVVEKGVEEGGTAEAFAEVRARADEILSEMTEAERATLTAGIAALDGAVARVAARREGGGAASGDPTAD